MRKKFLSALVLFSLVFLINCDKDDDPEPETPEMVDCSTFDDTYSDGIASIINSTCAVSGCHDGSNMRADLSNLDGIKAVSSQVRSRVASGSMPPSGRNMSQSNRNKVVCWVLNGTPD